MPDADARDAVPAHLAPASAPARAAAAAARRGAGRSPGAGSSRRSTSRPAGHEHARPTVARRGRVDADDRAAITVDLDRAAGRRPRARAGRGARRARPATRPSACSGHSTNAIASSPKNGSSSPGSSPAMPGEPIEVEVRERPVPARRSRWPTTNVGDVTGPRPRGAQRAAHEGRLPGAELARDEHDVAGLAARPRAPPRRRSVPRGRPSSARLTEASAQREAGAQQQRAAAPSGQASTPVYGSAAAGGGRGRARARAAGAGGRGGLRGRGRGRARAGARRRRGRRPARSEPKGSEYWSSPGALGERLAGRARASAQAAGGGERGGAASSAPV